MAQKKEKKRNEYWIKYAKKNYRQVKIIIRYDEQDVLNKLENVDSISQYIIKLIKDDLKKEE